MQVFVGNPTLQSRQVEYRVPISYEPLRYNRNKRTVNINPGGQAKLPDELSGKELTDVLEQLKAIGAVPASEAGTIILPKALIFDVRQNPIDVDHIEEGLERDEEARQEIAGEKMQESGLQAFKTAQDLAKNTRLQPIETIVEIVEVTDKGAVKGGVNTEFVVSNRPERNAGKQRTERKN